MREGRKQKRRAGNEANPPSFLRLISYAYDQYPANPNGSDYNAAGIASADGRHVAMMPHLERAFLPWQTPFYPADRRADDCTPWLEAFVNARRWVESHRA